MRIGKYSFITLLIILMAGVHSYGQPVKAPSQDGLERFDQEHSFMPIQPEDISERLRQIMSTIMKTEKPDHADLPQTDDKDALPIQEYAFSATEFGRENPFMPLTMEDVRSMRNDQRERESKEPNKPPSPLVRLTAVFLVSGARSGESTATIEEDGVSRSISVGDTVMGMEVMEIRRGEIILSGEAGTYTMMLGIPHNMAEFPRKR
jgi:hypothetical protein